jgi:hypothetical protein
LHKRKAFKRGAEHGVGFDRAAGGLVEPRERERGAELEAAGFLLLRDSDGGEEGLFGGGGVGGVLFAEDFAAYAKDLGVESAFPGALGLRDGTVQGRQGERKIAGLGLG